MESPSTTLERFHSREFTLFPKLPPELRLRVWSFALLVPRTVTISQVHKYKNTVNEKTGHWYNTISFHLRAISLVPGVPQASHESREQGLKVLKPVFPKLMNNKPFHFNFDIDQLCFISSGAISCFNNMKYLYFEAGEKEIEILNNKLKHLVVGGQIWGRDVVRHIAKMKNLETVIMEVPKSVSGNPQLRSGVLKTRISDSLYAAWREVMDPDADRPYIKFLRKKAIEKTIHPKAGSHRKKGK
jgi:hypothetical protein